MTLKERLQYCGRAVWLCRYIGESSYDELLGIIEECLRVVGESGVLRHMEFDFNKFKKYASEYSSRKSQKKFDSLKRDLSDAVKYSLTVMDRLNPDQV